MVELVPEQDEEHKREKKTYGFLLAGSILIAILYDFLFYDKVAGVSYPIFIFCVYAVLYRKVKAILIKKECFESFLTVPILALSLAYLFFSNQVLRTINSFLIPVLLVAHILLIIGKNRYEWFQLGFLKDILKGMLVWPFAHVPNLFHVISKLTVDNKELSRKSAIRNVLVGIIFSLPVIIFVIVLLSSADEVFGNMVKLVLSEVGFVEIIIHIMLIGFITALTFGFFCGLISSSGTKVPYKNVKPKLDVVSVLTGLCLLNIVYCLFSYIQFAYLFGPIFNLLPEGFSYAEYARRGFFELVVVAIVNVAIVLASLNLTNITGGHSGKIFKILNCGLVVNTFVMLFSSFIRMYLYEEVYGYTYLRVFTHEFMIMLFFLLGVTLYRVWTGKLNVVKWS